MSSSKASADDAGGEHSEFGTAIDLLERALTILDKQSAPADLRAHLHEIVESLAQR